MSSLNTITGRNGKKTVGTTQVARTTQWSLNQALATSSEWGDSDSEGFTNRAAGRKDATFSDEGKYDSASEVFDLFQPGDILISTLWLNAVDLYYDFPRSLNNAFNLVVNIDSEEVIGWTADWGADGVFTFPGEPGQEVRTLL